MKFLANNQSFRTVRDEVEITGEVRIDDIIPGFYDSGEKPITVMARGSALGSPLMAKIGFSSFLSSNAIFRINRGSFIQETLADEGSHLHYLCRTGALMKGAVKRSAKVHRAQHT